VIGLKSPTAPPSGAPPFMLVASSFSDPPAERLDLFMHFGAPLYHELFNETGSIERGNSMDLTPTPPRLHSASCAARRTTHCKCVAIHQFGKRHRCVE
jgi:hypothetical protein